MAVGRIPLGAEQREAGVGRFLQDLRDPPEEESSPSQA